MRAATATVGARVVDCVTLLTNGVATAMSDSGVDGAFQYLGSVTPTSLAGLMVAGLAFMPVTYADRFDGASTVAELRVLSIPRGVTVWLDVEGVTGVSSVSLIQQINDWAQAVLAAGWEPGLYVGAGSVLTSAELYQLKVVRYWHGMSRVVDRNGEVAEPMCGWCCHQLFDTQQLAGVPVDYNFVQKDWSGRLPTWAVAG
jgi:hypothetical protein